ncbi:MAG: inositol monophosphatase [Rhodospirillales bacterium]|nr:inositol monophosphatase [Rhodospirillales bacterium]
MGVGPDADKVIAIMRRVAAAEIMPRFGKLSPGEVTEKCGPKDLVTIADTLAEAALGEALTRLWPGSVAVGEEAADADTGLLQALAGDAPVWLIDPVDGTNNYVRGVACFAVIIGFCAGGDIRAGWIHDPIADTTIWAKEGEGTWLDTEAARRRLRLPPPKAVAQMTGSLGYRWSKRLKERLKAGIGLSVPRFVRYGCTGREYMDLAAGRLDFAAYTRLKPWDHAAGVLIYREAGGIAQVIANERPYRPQPAISETTLLLAPNQACWRGLKSTLDLPGGRATS